MTRLGRPKRRRWLSWLAILIIIAWGLGFVVFVSSLSTDWDLPEKADAIVALTGGQQRLRGAISLLDDGRADRLLISGVNPITTKEELRQLVNGAPELFECCVEIDYAAKDTIGNAIETAEWVQKNNITSLIVVTANYHMPRTLLEFNKALKGIVLYPYAVESDRVLIRRWLLDWKIAFFLAGEYTKFLASAVRLGLVHSLD